MSTTKAKAKKPKAPTKKKAPVRRSPSPDPDDDLPHLKYYAEHVESHAPEKDVRIDFNMIVRRNVPDKIRDLAHEDVIAALHSVSHVRLDREQITHIDNLEMLGTHVTNLYLQQNRISVLENMDCLSNLRFLTLSGNRILQVEGLTSLDKLKFLDLSHNDISNLDVDELPKSLMMLNLEGNPCTEKEGYRELVLSALPDLTLLDGRPVGDDGEESGSGSEDEDEEETAEDLPASPDVEQRAAATEGVNYPHRQLDEYMVSASVERYDVFTDVVEDIRQRSKRRVEEMDAQHEEHKQILKQIREEAQKRDEQRTVKQ